MTVRAPASTSNLGSGFDTLGLAFAVYNRVQVTRAPVAGVRLVSPVGRGEAAGARRLVVAAAREFFRHSGAKPFGAEVRVESEFPVGRGLGFSASARLGVVAGLNELAGTGLARADLLALVTRLEGHPDNASPAVFGGFTVSSVIGSEVRCHSFRVAAKLAFVTLLPPFGISTERARELLPAVYSKADTVHALNRAAMITAAFARRDYPALRGLFDDRVHQPCREPLIPELSRVIAAGEQAGAIGGFLSGSGSAIICLALTDAKAIGQAMLAVMPGSEVRIYRPENSGFTVESGQ